MGINVDSFPKELVDSAALIVIRSSRGDMTVDVAKLIELGADPRLVVVCLAHGESLEVLSEVEMAQLGWVRNGVRANEVSDSGSS